jgi:hypothetical protein
MQEAQWFQNQIIKPSNLDFMNASTAKNVQDSITAFTKGQPGVVNGLTIDTASIGTATANVLPGYGFLSTGERVQLYSPSGVTTLIVPSGVTPIFASLIEVNYNPDPSQNPAGPNYVASGLNAASLEFQAVEQYNLLQLTTVSGATFIKLAEVATIAGLITSIDYSNRQNLKVGEIDLFSGTIDGIIITPSSIDSNQFVSPLHYDVNIASGININFLGSGNQSIGSVALPLASVTAISGIFHDISGFSPILVDSLTQKVGTSLESNDTRVNIDTANKGTQFGSGTTGGIVINKNSIDLTNITNPSEAALAINTRAGAGVNINAGGAVTITPGAASVGVTINSPLTVTGTLTAPSLNIPFVSIGTLGVGVVSGNTSFLGNVGFSGNITSSGSLAFGSTEQQFENIIPNGLMFPSGTMFSGTNVPNVWDANNPNANYVVGPLGSAVQRLISFPAALNTATTGMTQYTMEWVFKINNVASPARLYAATSSGPSGPRFEVVGARLYYFNQSVGSDFGIGAGYVVWTNPSTIQSNRFYHAALTASGTTTKLFLDGFQPIANSSNINYGANIPSSITSQNLGLFNLADAGIDGNLEIKAFKISNKAHTVFPSGLVNLEVDADTIALYDFNNSPSGVDKSGFGRNLSFSTPAGTTMPFYEAPSGTNTVGSKFLGQSLSGSSVRDYTRDIAPIGSVNVFSGATNSPYFFQVSGNNITSNGLNFSTPLNVENSKEYNISYFTKLISGSSIPLFAPSSNNVGVRAYVSGTGYLSPIFSGSNLSGQWTQNSFDFVAPSTGQNFNLYLNTYSASGNTVSGTSMIGLSSVQATKGSAQLSTITSGPRIITLVHDSINRQINDNSGVINYFSGAVFSNGGLATITPSLKYAVVITASGYNPYKGIKHFITLNGVTISAEGAEENYNSVYGSYGASSFVICRGWTGYLKRGANIMTCTLQTIQGGDSWYMIPNQVGGIDLSINVPKTDIIMY